MSGKNFEWSLTLQIMGVLIAFVTAIPTVYNFEKQRFFWQVNSGQQEVTQSRESIKW